MRYKLNTTVTSTSLSYCPKDLKFVVADIVTFLLFSVDNFQSLFTSASLVGSGHDVSNYYST